MFEFTIRLLGSEYLCRCRYAETRERILTRMPARGDYAVGPLLQSGIDGTTKKLPVVEIRPEDWEAFPEYGLDHSAVSEASFLTACFSEALLARDCVILHGVALRWKGWAYLICAAPGTGKSTQARFLQELRPGEIGIICGDRPILEFRHSSEHRDEHCSSAASLVSVGADAHIGPPVSPAPPCYSERSEESASPVPKPSPSGEGVTVKTVTDEGQILVHPSPWNGKENWHGADAAPLAGLILLERGEENSLISLPDREAALPMYLHFIHTGWDMEKIRRIADLETRLLRSVPIWKLTSFEVPDSTKLLLESVFS